MLEVSFPEDLQIFLNIFCRNYCRYELKFLEQVCMKVGMTE